MTVLFSSSFSMSRNQLSRSPSRVNRFSMAFECALAAALGESLGRARSERRDLLELVDDQLGGLAELTEHARLMFDQVEAALLRALKRAQDAGELAGEPDLRGLASYLRCVLHGLSTMAKLPATKRQLRAIVDSTLSVLEE